MKRALYGSPITIALFFASCGNSAEKVEGRHADNAFSWEMSDGDTINRTDANGKKQGLWIIKPMHRPHDTLGDRIDTFYYKDDIQVEKP